MLDSTVLDMLAIELQVDVFGLRTRYHEVSQEDRLGQVGNSRAERSAFGFPQGVIFNRKHMGVRKGLFLTPSFGEY